MDMFLGMGALCHMIKGRDADLWHFDQLDQAYKLSASVWPPAFGVIFGLFFKNLAHYRSIQGPTRLIVKNCTGPLHFRKLN